MRRDVTNYASQSAPAATQNDSNVAVMPWLRGLDPYDPDLLSTNERDGVEPVRLTPMRSKRTVAAMFFAAFLGFVLWASIAPIDGGVALNGTVVVKGNRRLLQHPAGGVVEQIHVREGDTVRQGDMLLKINQLSTDAALNSTELEYINAMAVESRLLSEQDNRQEVSWLPEIVKAADDPRVEEAKRQQARLFLSRKTEINGQLRILRERLYGLRSQASELSRVISARSQQLKNMGSEVAKNTELAAKGFVSRTRVSEVERLQSEVIASLATARADLGKARSEIASTQLEIDQHLAVYRREVDAELGETKKQRGALRSKVESLKFDRSLTELRAPVTGTVVALKVHTIGGVIQPGEVLLEVVPNEGMIVEARVPPRLIDKVKSGLEADMRFTAFNANTTPVVPGIVKMVGADRLVENSKDKPDEYYLIQIEADEGIKHLKGQRVQPGMPVDVVIKTGERTFVSYLFKPITDRLATSFKD